MPFNVIAQTACKTWHDLFEMKGKKEILRGNICVHDNGVQINTKKRQACV